MDIEPAEKRTFLCECIKTFYVAGDTIALEFVWQGPLPRGGQFFLVRPRRSGVFLGRPLSVAGWRPRVAATRYKGVERRASADRRSISNRSIRPNTRLLISRRVNTDRRQNAGIILRFLVVRRGKGSRELVDLRPGEEVELSGPLGNFWAQVDIPSQQEGPIALVAGGVGIAPLLTYIPELGERSFDLYAGFRTGSFGLENIKSQVAGLRSLIVATEDGSQGLKGRIPDFFTPSGYSRVLACGPEPMLKAVGDVCIANAIPCFISVERYMACGVGACLGCTVKTTGGNRRCCKDGPIFSAEEVCFDSPGT